MAVNNLKLLLIMILTRGSIAVLEYCGKLPEIQFSTSNISGIQRYQEGEVVGFSCWSGYASTGRADYVCTDGQWIGGPFSCLIKKCSPLGSPIDGNRIGESHEVGSVMRFKCHTGFELVGSPTMLCKANAVWNPLNIPDCRRKRCPTIPLIENGTVVVKQSVNGQTEVFGTILEAKCHERFIRNGPANIYCTEKGQWTAVPTCELVSCPPFPGLDSNCVSKSKLHIAAYDTLLFLYCTENSTMTGNGVAACKNTEWDDVTLGCWCDCSIKADYDLVQFENLNAKGLLTHGETLTWSCKHGNKMATTKQLTCIDGSVGKPVCDPDNLSTTGQDSLLKAIYFLPGITVIIFILLIWQTWRKKHYQIPNKQTENTKLEDTNKKMTLFPLDYASAPHKDDGENYKVSELNDIKNSSGKKSTIPVGEENVCTTDIDSEEDRQIRELERKPFVTFNLAQYFLKSNERQWRQPGSLMNKARPTTSSRKENTPKLANFNDRLDESRKSFLSERSCKQYANVIDY